MMETPMEVSSGSISCSIYNRCLPLNHETGRCSNCSLQIRIRNSRLDSAECLRHQAKRMKAISDHSHPPAEIGQNVPVPIPDVDKGRGALRNVICVVLERTEDHFYKLGTLDGILQALYERLEFDICQQVFVRADSMKMKKTISLRTAASSVAVGSGQGFLRCLCVKKMQQ